MPLDAIELSDEDLYVNPLPDGSFLFGAIGNGTGDVRRFGKDAILGLFSDLAVSGAFGDLTATPTTLAGYGITDAQPLDSDLTSIAGVGTQAFGRSVLAWADQAAGRTALGLGTLALLSAFAFADLSSHPTSIGGYGITDAYTKAEINSAFAGLATVASTGAYADLSGKPTLGTAAAQAIGTSGANVPLLNGANTWSAAQTIAGGTLNGTVLDISQTWGGTGTYTGIKFNLAADTGPSNAASLLLDLQMGGASKFAFRRDGVFRSASGGLNVRDDIYVGVFGVGDMALLNDSAQIRFRAAADAILTSDAANNLAQRNGPNAQTFNLYNTHTDPSNYERGGIQWNSNFLKVFSEGAGTGANTRGIRFRVSSTDVWEIAGATGHLLAVTDNAFDIGDAATRPRTGYFGTRLQAPVVRADNSYTVATLPTGVVGNIARVTDANSPAIGSTVSGGGAAAALVWYNGSNYTVIGV